MFDAGSARDGAKFGLAALTSALLDSGAGAWDADTVAQRLENVGALLNTGVGRDSAYVWLRSLTLPDKLSVALDTAREVLAHPRFDPKDLDREKNRALLAIKQRGKNRTSWPTWPFSRPSTATIPMPIRRTDWRRPCSP